MKKAEKQMKLKLLRTEREVTMQQMADMLGITAGTYSNKEAGKFDFTFAEAKKISKFFGKDFNDIFL